MTRELHCPESLDVSDSPENEHFPIDLQAFKSHLTAHARSSYLKSASLTITSTGIPQGWRWKTQPATHPADLKRPGVLLASMLKMKINNSFEQGIIVARHTTVVDGKQRIKGAGQQIDDDD